LIRRLSAGFYQCRAVNHHHIIAESHISKGADASSGNHPARSSSIYGLSNPTLGHKKTADQFLSPMPTPPKFISLAPAPPIDFANDMMVVDSTTLIEPSRQTPNQSFENQQILLPIPSSTEELGTVAAHAGPVHLQPMSMDEQVFDWPDVSAMDADGYLRFFESSTINAPLDCTFDWFSWNAYESAQVNGDSVRY